jgi:16S rRNA (uracil1498-N3)-methyltransferase
METVMDYFYVQQHQIIGNAIVIQGEESKHLARVLRKSVGESVFVTDGNDRMYEAVITEIGKSETHCTIKAIHSKYHEPSLDVTLAVSLLKNPARLDFLVEKATELGVRHIIPLHCERTISSHEKHDRLEKLAVAAMKQCGRSWLPRIAPLMTLEELFHNSSQDLKFLPHEKSDSTQSIASSFHRYPACKTVLIVIGPEGGFTDEEVHEALGAGFLPVSLGVRRLRAETAAIVAASHVIQP